MAPTESLAAGLSAQGCTSCGGTWIASDVYRAWLEAQPSARGVADTSSPRIAIAGEQPARICPVCRRIMVRYSVGHGANVVVDVCGTCFGTWLDAGEWGALVERGLERDLNRVTSDVWQSSVRREEAARHLEGVRRRLLGDDYDEVIRIRDWLKSHPHRDEIMAVLVSHDEAAR